MADGAARIFGLSAGGARWVLGLSLAANFLFIGIAGGAALKMIGEPHGPDRGGFQLSRQIIEAAGEDRREAVRALIEGARGESWRDASRRRWSEVADHIAAAPFDGPALAAMFAAEDERREAMRATRNAATVEALALLTDEERARLSAAMQAHLERREEKR